MICGFSLIIRVKYSKDSFSQCYCQSEHEYFHKIERLLKFSRACHSSSWKLWTIKILFHTSFITYSGRITGKSFEKNTNLGQAPEKCKAFFAKASSEVKGVLTKVSFNINSVAFFDSQRRPKYPTLHLHSNVPMPFVLIVAHLPKETKNFRKYW